MQRVILWTAAILILASAAGATAQPTKFLRQPHVANDGRIAFVYHGDIWVVEADGSNPLRLTNHVAADEGPRFSPDGATIAFTSNRMGNNDVWVVDAKGGVPRQITFHSTGDTVRNWTPDGEGIVFSSSRSAHPFLNPLYIVKLYGSIPTPMAMDQGATGMIKQDGSMLAFNKIGMSTDRKHYRGNRQTDIHVQDLTTKKIAQLTDLNAREYREHVQDGHPMWGADGMIYFVSERGGTYNVFKIAADGGNPIQVTMHDEDGVQNPTISPDGGTIAYENEFDLWTLAVPDGRPNRLAISLTFEPKENEFNYLDVSDAADGFSPSPDGQWVAVDRRGEIFIVPAEEGVGEKTQVTASPWRDRYQVFSPDGKHLAYVTDSTHEEEIWLYTLETREHRKLSEHESTKREIVWAPDSEGLIFVGANEMVHVDIATGRNTRLGRNAERGYSGIQFSSDGRWLVYSRSDEDLNGEVYLFDIDERREYNVTDHPAREGNASLTPDGKRVVFTSNRDGGTNHLFVVSLARLTEDPDDPLNKLKKKQTEEKKSEEAPEELDIRIDPTDIDRRAVQLTRGSEGVAGVFLSREGDKIFFLQTEGGTRALYSIGLDGEGRTKVADGAFGGATLTTDGKTLFYSQGDRVWRMGLANKRKEQVAFDFRVFVDHRGEWEQIFEEAWRSMKYRFYDADMHGFDWNAIKAAYKPMLAYVGAYEDVHDLANEMIGELNASHVGVRGSPSRSMERVHTTRLPGFELEADGDFYRVSHVYRDGPADKEWLDIEVGDYVTAIDGKQIEAGDNYWKILNETLNDYVEFEMSDDPGSGVSRVARIRPVASLGNIQYEEWVHDNRKFVEKESDGKIAYVHIRSMNQPSLVRFQNEIDRFWNAEGIVVDIRYNGGGNIDQQLLDILERRPYEYWNNRWSSRAAGRRPRQAIAGPKVMLINNRSGSDSEVTPQGFRDLGLGSIVGTPTAGAVIATGSYSLIHGGTIRTPGSMVNTYDPTQPNNYGINLENYGVPPDVWAENTSEDELAGFDRELKAAVNEALRMLEEGGPWQYRGGSGDRNDK
jgi:tricorn protease